MSTGPSAHAVLGPSSAHRWMACPGSVRAIRELPRSMRRGSSPAALEGTAAHALAELQLRADPLGEDVRGELRQWESEYGDAYGLASTGEGVSRYVSRVRSEYRVARALDPAATLRLEQRVRIDDRIYGTADALIVGAGVVHVLDLKYGRGVRVSATRNPQLRIYGLAALRDAELIGDVHTVRMTIVQPRHRDGGHESTEELPADYLRAWGLELEEAARATDAPDAPRIPGDDQCRWCDAAPLCPARTAQIAERIGLTSWSEPPTPPPAVTEGEALARVLPHLDSIEQWCRATRESALALSESGTGVPGWHVEEGRGRRAMTVRAAERLAETTGVPLEDLIRETPRPLGEVRRLVGRGRLDEVDDLLEHRPGSARLVADE